MKLAVFRVDGAPFIGIGHIMRCLTLAEKLRSAGWNIQFISRAFDNHLAGIINEKGYECFLLTTPHTRLLKTSNQSPKHAHWLGVGWQQDAQETRSVINHCDLLIVDHYGIDACWHKALRNAANKILVIDDLADRLLDCDIVLDQTYRRSSVDYKVLTPEHCQALCGSDYMLLRDVFANKRAEALKKRKTLEVINRVFICMGSVDPTNVTACVLAALNHYIPKLHLDVIISSKAPYLKELMVFKTHHTLNIHVDCRNVEDLMVEADIAFGAGGTMSWERCCLGLPTILVVIAENQKLIAQKLENAGAIKNLGWHNKIKSDDIWEVFNTLEIAQVRIISEKAANICDGKGVDRVIKNL